MKGHGTRSSFVETPAPRCGRARRHGDPAPRPQTIKSRAWHPAHRRNSDTRIRPAENKGLSRTAREYMRIILLCAIGDRLTEFTRTANLRRKHHSSPHATFHDSFRKPPGRAIAT